MADYDRRELDAEGSAFERSMNRLESRVRAVEEELLVLGRSNRFVSPVVQTRDLFRPVKVTGEDIVSSQPHVVVSWSPVTTDILSYYEVQIAEDSAFSVSLVTKTSTELFVVWSGGVTTTTYHARVRAVNDAGAGLWSEIASDTA